MTRRTLILVLLAALATGSVGFLGMQIWWHLYLDHLQVDLWRQEIQQRQVQPPPAQPPQ